MYQLANYFCIFFLIFSYIHLIILFKVHQTQTLAFSSNPSGAKNIKQCKLSINRLNYSRLMFASVPRKSLQCSDTKTRQCPLMTQLSIINGAGFISNGFLKPALEGEF